MADADACLFVQVTELGMEHARINARLQARRHLAAKQSARRSKLAKSEESLSQGVSATRSAGVVKVVG